MTEIAFENGLTLTLGDENDAFGGVRALRAGAVALKSDRQPASVEIWTPDGIAIEDFRITNQQTGPDGIDLTMSAHARPGRLMEWMLHEARQRLNTTEFVPESCPASETPLRFTAAPVVRQIGEFLAVGIRYQYHYRSEKYPIYKILDKATWEIGGRAAGNTFWLRNGFAPSIFPITDCSQSYSSEWYLPSASNPNVFQFLPWQTALEGFTMTAHAEGTLITWATEVRHIRSLFEKQSGCDEMRHWHEHCGDLSSEFSTAPMEVLWIPGGLDRVGLLNLHESVRDLVYETLHAQVGMRRERATSYGVIEDWSMPDMDRYRTHALPRFADAGVKTVFVTNLFENNMNTYGVSNICCTVDYKVAENIGEDNVTAFCQAAHDRDIKVEMWGNTALSALTYLCAMRDDTPKRIDFLPIEGSVVEVLQRAQDPWVRNAFGAIETDHYSPSFSQLNMLDPDIRAYWMRRWTHAHDAIGLDQIFLDSSFNMTSDKFHWIANPRAKTEHGGTVDQSHLLGHKRPKQEPPAAILSQYRAHLDLMAEMQRAGYVYCAEDTGVFGIHRSGPGIAARLNNMALWSDSFALFDLPAIQSAGADPDAVYFMGLAYRMVWQLHWDIQRDELSFHVGSRRGEFDAPTAWHIALVKAYNAVAARMDRRTVLANEAGVLYADAVGKSQVLWSFESATIPFEQPMTIQNVLTGETIPDCYCLHASRHHVYQLTPIHS